MLYLLMIKRVRPSSIIVLCFLCKAVIGQTNKPVNSATVPAPTATVRALPPAYDAAIPLNYIRVWEPQKAYQLETDVTSNGRTVEEVHRATQYFDGLGRPMETVAWQQSSDKKDIVSVNGYDPYGREVYKYLPFVSTQVGGMGVTGDGNFKNNPYQQQQIFCQLQYPGEQFFYSKINYESSPLNRAIETFDPGNSWAGSEGATNAHSVKMSTRINDATDQVRIWNITSNAFNYSNDNIATNIPVTTAKYDAGLLYKTVTTGENDKQVVEYKDMNGRVILKKVQASATPSAAHIGWLCTYYVYDDMDMLRFVIPPAAVTLLRDAATYNWNLTFNNNSLLKEMCFRYEYDARQRMIAKKVPGAGWVYMVYDSKDRLVFTQDANMRTSSQWMTMLYDDMNRPVLTGMVTTSLAHTQLISNMDALNYTSMSTVDGISVNASPLPAGSSFISLTKTFYDNYNWTTTSYNSSYNSKLLSTAFNAETVPAQPTKMTEGMVTGTQVRVIEDPTNLSLGIWLTTVSFYDQKARPIQVNSINYKGGTDITSNLYDFTGKPLSSFIAHTNPDAGAQKGLGTDIQYDHAGRITKIIKRVYNNTADANPATITKIADNIYNTIGQLLTKQLGQQRDVNGNYTSTLPIETLDYEYNIRGWLKSINKKYNKATSTNRWFGMELSYDWGYNSKQYNGNIAGITWRSKGDGERRSYGFGYDNINRLLFADFKQYTGSTWNNDAGIDFTVKMGDGLDYTTAYDDNGNILRMQQWGVLLNTSPQIDDLVYHYDFSTSNKLSSVTDNAPPLLGGAGGGLGDFTDKNTSGSDYGYDVNGNLLTDKNKNLNGNTGNNQATGAIEYNFLNLPWKIKVKKDDGAMKGNITYIYDAAGNKLEKKITENGSPSTITITDYLGAFVYNTVTTATTVKKLEFMGMEEGRIREKKDAAGSITGYSFDYFIKDHLGNIRMVLTDEQQQDIYPAATLEGVYGSGTSAVDVEKNYYLIDNTKITDKADATGITDYQNNNGNPPYNNNPNGNATASSQKLYKLKATAAGGVTGLGITLKVMSGDKVDAFAKTYYFENTTGSNSGKDLLITDILAGMLGAPGSTAAAHGATVPLLTTGTNATVLPAGILGHPVNAGDIKPKAYINYILFDEEFKYVASGFSRVGNQNEVMANNLSNISVAKNGYIYVYCSNESKVDVFFDNLQVIHTRGPLLEETHYYPFGLTMGGISSKALSFGGGENKKKFQGQDFATKEFSDGGGLDIYEFKWRMNDPQTGRFWQIDPMASKYVGNSTYAFSENRVTDGVDLEGLEWAKVTDGSQTTGYIWDPQNAYVEGTNTLKDGYYRTAIYFTDNGTFDETNDYNMGSSTATVYKVDGTTEDFQATIYPARLNEFPSMPEGDYTAAVGTHHGETALHLTNTGDYVNSTVNLGFPNPNVNSENYNTNIATYIHIHWAGRNNKTGRTSDNKNVSEGCLLIDANNWNNFIANFTGGISSSTSPTSITISRSARTSKKLSVIRVPCYSNKPTVTRYNQTTHTYEELTDEEANNFIQQMLDKGLRYLATGVSRLTH